MEKISSPPPVKNGDGEKFFEESFTLFHLGSLLSTCKFFPHVNNTLPTPAGGGRQ